MSNIVAQRVIKNTGFLYGKMGITMFLSLYTTRIVLDNLGISDFGIFNIVGGFIAMLSFLNATMTGVTQRFMSYAEGQGKPERKRNVFNISVILHFCIAIIMGGMLFITGYYLFNTILNIPSDRIYAAKTIYYCMIISTMSTVLTVPYDAVINAHENMLYYAVLGILESVLKVIVAVILIYTSMDRLIVYGILMASVSVIIVIIMRIYCHKKYSECIISPLKYYDKELMVSMMSFAGWNFLNTTSAMISQYGLGLILNNFFGAILNAAQSIANQISGQLMAFSNTMLKAVNPLIAKSEGEGDRNLMLNTALKASKFSFLLLAFFAIPFMIETPYILSIWLKEVPNYTVTFTRFQLLRSLIDQFTILIGMTVIAQGEISSYSKFKSLLNISPIIITYILFYYNYPSYYLYIVWIVFDGLLGGMISLYFSKKKCDLKYNDFYNSVFKPCIVVVCFVSVASILPTIFLSPSIQRLIVVSTISLCMFFLLLFTLILSKEEKRFLLSNILNVKRLTLRGVS